MKLLYKVATAAFDSFSKTASRSLRHGNSSGSYMMHLIKHIKRH